ncbi:hypothetical protein MUK42_27023 [Musa troglodytarum]|uniref:Uncharacterized protein n=1 Tax=Musa troglodytarum TaxID=320322 RepID=A0A9E7FAV1_9LILI|nr:hypothetical protein MUK42_27023 [Musa troglodytarum]
MVCSMSTRTVIVFLLSLIALEDLTINLHACRSTDLAASNSFTADIAVYGCSYVQEHKRNEELGASSQKLLRGRKMVEEVRSAANTGAKHWIKEHEHGEDGRSSVGSELRHQIRHSRVHFAGFVSFSSDYRAPKNHPPKHN